MAVATITRFRTKGIRVFTAGEKRDRFGRVRTWHLSELEEAASSYDPNLKRADVRIGHDSPIRKGWISRFYVQGNALCCDYEEVDPEFAFEANQGYYKKRSISFLPPLHPDNPKPGSWYPIHVAYVAIPADKGMPDHQFEEQEAQKNQGLNVLGFNPAVVGDIEETWNFEEDNQQLLLHEESAMGIAVPILRAGETRDSGRWDEDELKALSLSYNPEHHEAPVLVDGGGENKSYGWVKGIRVEEGVALAEINPVNDQFGNALQSEDYQERVVELYSPTNPSNPTPGKWGLRLIRVKGLSSFGEGQDYQFNEPEPEEPVVEVTQFSEKTLNYAEIGWRAFNAMGAIAAILGRQRDRAIEAGGLDTADQDYPQTLLDTIMKEGDNYYATLESVERLLSDRDRELYRLQNRIDDLERMLQGRNNTPQLIPAYQEAGTTMTTKEEFDALAARLKAIEEGQHAAATQRERQQAHEFCEQLVRNYQIRASEKDGWVEQLLTTPDTEPTIQFTEGETVTPRQALMKRLSAMPKFLDNRRLTVGSGTDLGMSELEYAEAEGFSQDSADDNRAIQSIMTEKQCDYSAAYAIARQRGIIKSL
jgi:hypothetical protein